MRKLKVLLLTLLMIGMMFNGVFADDNDKLTIILDDGTVVFAIDENGEMGYKALNEFVVTNDTITAAESGKVFFLDPSSTPIHMTLPTAAAGLTYEWVSAEKAEFYLVPQTGDVIRYSEGASAALAAGDRLVSPGGTGDTVRLTATTALIWHVSDIATPDTAGVFKNAN